MPVTTVAGVWTTQAILSSELGFTYAGLSGGHIVWSQYDGNDHELFSYRNGVVQQITDNDVEDIEPLVFEDRVAWMQNDSDSMHLYSEPTWNVVVDDIVIAESIPNNTDLAIGPLGVSWSAPAGKPAASHVFLYDGLETRQLSLSGATSNHNPSVGSSGVVWSGFDDAGNHAYFWDGESTRQLPDNVGMGQLPKISGDFVVGIAVTEGWLIDAISIYDIASDTLKLVPVALEGFTSSPSIAGQNIAWGKHVDGVNQVYWLDGDFPKQLTFESTSAYGPFVSESLVAWSSQGPPPDIYVHDGVRTTKLTDDLNRKGILAVSGNNLLWERWDGVQLHLMLSSYLVPEPGCTSLILVGLATCSQRSRRRNSSQ